MQDRGVVVAVGGLIVTVQLGLFAWLKADFADVADRLGRVEREVAFMSGQLSLVLPALAARSPAPEPDGHETEARGDAAPGAS